MQTIATIDELRQMLCANPDTKICAGSTKTSLSNGAEFSLSSLSGILNYEPSEYTFTALAGTKLSEIESVLNEHGQFLPFDPPMVSQGATLGGTVAAGLSGSGRFRYGGVRDFFLGVKFITRKGRTVFGGSKVVKNAAGFDIPKLMVGSLGQFGVMAELTFKVFPRPKYFTTIVLHADSVERATALLQELGALPLDLTCLDFEPESKLILRLGGLEKQSIMNRVHSIRQIIPCDLETLDDDRPYWRNVNDFQWCSESESLVKLPLTPTRIAQLERFLKDEKISIARRYCVGGNLAWLAWPNEIPISALGDYCRRTDCTALVIRGPHETPFINPSEENRFHARLRSTFSPA